MKTILIIVLTLSLMRSSTVAAPSQGTLADQYFSDHELILTPQEKAAIAIGQKWQTGSTTSQPFAGANGAITYVYTTGQVQIMCAVFQVCDIALQPGEQINNLNVGDPRFNVEPAITGSGETQTLHLLIKPLDVGLDTSLVVTTNRRTYHFRLRSSRTQFMPFVSFTYPEEAWSKWRALRTQKQKEHRNKILPQTGESLDHLDFNYEITGSARWKPIRVYNNGRKTIIEMPETLSQNEAPTLLIVREGNSLWGEDDLQMVNYRLHGQRYIVDIIFDEAILIAGVGLNQEKVTIIREKK